MSAKLLHALTEDHPDLQKQIGCMTGIFQLFDRQQIITGRRITNHSHKRIPPAHSHIDDSNVGDESNNVCYPHSVTGKYCSKNVNEKHRTSTESSRLSFSSSSSSSTFASSDYNKTARPEPSPPIDRNIFPGTSSRDQPVNQPKSSTQSARQSLDFRNVVKDCMYKETRGLSVKTIIKEEPVNHTVKRRDSPRPLQLSEVVDGSYGVEIIGKSRVPADFTESLRALGKLREGGGYLNDTKERPRSSYEVRNGSSLSVSMDAPRFSYDEREPHRSSFESRDSSITNVKELPRLSLDGRESLMRSSDLGPKSNSMLKDLQKDSGEAKRTPSPLPELGSQKQHTSSVVAKLMGLEVMPSTILDTDGQRGFIQTYPNEDRASFSRSLERTIEQKQTRTSSSPRGSLKDPMSPRFRSQDIVMKPIPNSRLPIEPAPWRQLDGGRGIQKLALRNREIQRRPPNSSTPVYGDMDKRLKELEFKQADKDLKALKQMLDVMQEKRQLEANDSGSQASYFESQSNYNYLNQMSLDQLSRLGNRQNQQNNHPVSVTVKGAMTYESPIVIMKPVKHIEKSCIPASSTSQTNGFSLPKPQNGDTVGGKKASVSRVARDLIPKPNLKVPTNTTISSNDKKVTRTTLGSAHNSSKPQQLPRESTASSGKDSGSISPRLQRKKLELDKRARPPVPSSDLSKHRKQPVKQTTEAGSPGGKRRPKCSNLQQTDVQLSEISIETRNLSHQEDEISLRSDSNVSLASQIDIDVTSADRSAEITCELFQQGNHSPSTKVANSSISITNQEKPLHKQRGDRSLAELTTVGPEQPSPVSVLDASAYQDDSPSPVKNTTSDLFKDDGSRISDDYPVEEWKPTDLGHSYERTRPDLSSCTNRKKLEKVENLVQKLRRLNSNHDESTTDYIASLCEKDNPDDRYISEILLASGLLLRDLGSGLTSIQLHPSGYPINPDLFLVLEQTKASNRLSKNNHSCEKVFPLKSDQEKVHRKLVFDAVNEVLDRKLPLLGPSTDPWLRDDKLVGRTLNAQQLLRELCSEIEKLQATQNLDNNFDDDGGLKPILFKDVMSLSNNWTESRTEVSGVVLDIERLIFKDLVDEIVSSEAVTLRAKPNRRRRQLFASK